jgi:hypothetical protein
VNGRRWVLDWWVCSIFRQRSIKVTKVMIERRILLFNSVSVSPSSNLDPPLN